MEPARIGHRAMQPPTTETVMKDLKEIREEELEAMDGGANLMDIRRRIKDPSQY